MKTFKIICQCANTGCVERLRVSIADYERVRRAPGWFFITPGHVVPDGEPRNGNRRAMSEWQELAELLVEVDLAIEDLDSWATEPEDLAALERSRG